MTFGMFLFFLGYTALSLWLSSCVYGGARPKMFSLIKDRTDANIMSYACGVLSFVFWVFQISVVYYSITGQTLKDLLSMGTV